MRQAYRGFTLIELMIAVAIVAILARISYPVYIQYVVKANRADAESQLMQLAQAMERDYAINDRYNSAMAVPSNLARSPATGTIIYNISILVTLPAATPCLTSTSATQYLLQATPLATGVNKNDGYLLLDSLGGKCWNKYNQGTIVSSWTP
jgi:type IV pilus assembly protein PilE